MVSDLLSQDEINSLLQETGNEEKPSETPDTNVENNEQQNPELDVENLKQNFFNYFADSGQSILSELSGKEVKVELESVEKNNWTDILENLKDKKIKFSSKFTDSCEDSYSIYADDEFFGVIAVIMNGEEELKVPEEFDEMYVSAVNEALNQIVSSGLNSFSQSLDDKTVGSDIPEVNLQEISDDYKDDNIEDECVAAKFSFSMDDYENKPLYYILSVDTAEKLNEIISGGSEEQSETTETQQQEAHVEQPVQQSQEQQQPAQQQTLASENLPDNQKRNVEMLLDVPLTLNVSLGKSSLLVKDILNLGIGSIIELDRYSSEPIDLSIKNKPIARGDVVVVDENFGLRITELVSPAERLEILKQQ